MAEPLGELDIQIVGDFSSLQDSINNAVSASEQGAQEISKAFSSVQSSGAEEALGSIGDAAQEASTKMQGLGDEGQALGTALQQTGTNADTASGGVEHLGSAAEEAGTKFEGFGENIAKLAELAGLVVTFESLAEALKDIAKESVEAFSNLQLITAGMSALTGSAEGAEEALEKIKAIAGSSIFSFPDLAAAAQRMAAIGVSVEELPAAMQAVADSAEVTGRSLDAVASSLDRIFLSGNLNTRTLSQLGISMQDLADTMGISADQVATAFKGMGAQSQDALDILVTTIESRTSAAAGAIEDTLPVAINALKVEWDSLLEEFGKQIAPGLTDVINDVRELLPYLEQVASTIADIGLNQLGSMLSSFSELTKTVQALGTSLGIVKDQFSFIGGLVGSVFNVNDLVNYLTHWKDLADVFGLITAALEKWGAVYASQQVAANNLLDTNKQIAQAAIQETLDHDAAALAAQRHAAAIAGIAAAAKDTSKDFDELGQEEASAFEQADKLLSKMPADFADFQAGLAQGFNFKGLDTQFEEFIQNLQRTGLAGTQFGQSLVDAVTAAKSKLDDFLSDQALAKAQAGLDAVTDSLAKLNQVDLDKGNASIDKFFQTLDQGEAKHPFDTLTQDLQTLGITADGETKKMAGDFAAFDGIVQSSASTLDMVEGAWAKIQKDITALSKDPDGLTRVVSLTQQYGDYLAKADAPLSQQLAAWVQIYQAQLKAAEQDDASVAKITLIGEALDNAKAKQNAFTDSTQGLLNLYTNVQKEFSTAWTEFGTGIGDAIAGTESFSTAFKNAISDMEKKLSELVVNYLLGQLKDAFLQNTDALSTFGKVFNSIFGVGGGPSSGASSAAGGVESLGFGAGQDTASKDLLGSVASSSEATASGITQMAGGIISELTSVVSLIGSIGQLITGIVQDFEQAHTNNLLDRIELSTRQTATFLGSGGGVLDYLNHILAAEVNESSAFTGWFHDALASLMSTVEDIDSIDKQMLGMGLSGGGSSGGGGGSSTPFDLGLPTTQGSSTVTTDLSNATSSLDDSSASLADAAPTIAAASTSINTAAQSLTVAAYSLSTSAAQNPPNGSTAAPNFVTGPYATTSITPQQLTENGQALANTMSLTVGGINVLGNSAQDLAAKIDALGGSLTASDRATALELLGAAGPGATSNTLTSAYAAPSTPQLTPAQVQALNNLVSTIPGQGFTGGGPGNTLSASPTYNLNFAGAHIYGSQGAQQFGTSLVNALKQNASLIKY